jgi:hypothetical protein
MTKNKYRAWSKSHKTWFNHTVGIWADGTIVCGYFEERSGEKPFYHIGLIDPLDTVIQKETGSTDSAQKPIYEGDVVLWHTEDPFDCTYFYKKMVVGWNQRCMQFRLYEFPSDIKTKSGNQFWVEDVKVIGHIFDYENEECRYHLDESVKSLIKRL